MTIGRLRSLFLTYFCQQFKSNNPEFVKLAMDGDQTALRPNSIGAGYIDLKPPQSLINKYISTKCITLCLVIFVNSEFLAEFKLNKS